MASAISPRSPLLNAALNSPIEFLPVTRFPVDDKIDPFQKLAVEKEKEREVIQTQPYRTTQLIYPGPKPKPDMVDNKLTGKKPTIFRPLDQTVLLTRHASQNIVGNLNTNTAVVHRQFNSPRPLYSQQNVAEAVYVQTGYNVPSQGKPQQQQQQQQQMRQPLQQQRQAPAPQARPLPQARNIPPPASPAALAQSAGPIHMTPDSLPEFNPQKSPTFRAIIEMEGLGTLQPAPNTQTQKIPQQPANTQKYAHSTAPTHNLNSVGMPNDRIAQSHSFRRLMFSLTE